MWISRAEPVGKTPPGVTAADEPVEEKPAGNESSLATVEKRNEVALRAATGAGRVGTFFREKRHSFSLYD